MVYIQKVAKSEMFADFLTETILDAKLRKTFEYIGIVCYDGERSVEMCLSIVKGV